MLSYLKSRRREFDKRLSTLDIAHTFSLERYRLHAHLSEMIARFACGTCLDAGSGRSPYGKKLEARGCRVLTVDIENRTGRVDILADLQDMPDVDDQSMDTVLCSQVLEHLPRPWDAMSEMARVLRPGGYLVLSVPHLSPLHEIPNDFYRYTRYGLESLCHRADLEVIEIRESGGWISFIAHGCSLLLTGTVGSLPLLRWPIWILNYVLLVRVAGFVDSMAGLQSVVPCDYVLLARKPR